MRRFPTPRVTTPVLICGEVMKTGYLPYGRWRRGFQAVLEEIGSGAFAKRITCRWFNMPYVAKMIATGMRMVAYGKPRSAAHAASSSCWTFPNSK